jgi:hypothetical protein
MIGSFAWRSRSLRGRRTQFFVLPEICCTDILADNPQTDIIASRRKDNLIGIDESPIRHKS